MAEAIAASKSTFAVAMFAELFASPARNVSVFFADLFGMRAVYNKPGVIADDNWSLRIPSDFVHKYQQAYKAGLAMDLPGALALALRALPDPSEDHLHLAETLVHISPLVSTDLLGTVWR